MPTVEVWVVLDQNGSCEVATDADTALERLIDGSGDDFGWNSLSRHQAQCHNDRFDKISLRERALTNV